MTGKIAAIKAVRNMFGIGLKEAKDVVDGAVPHMTCTKDRYKTKGGETK